MGDRGNIYCKMTEERGIYFYAHWEGSRLPQIAQDALRFGESRWYDPPYLNRIIFERLVSRDSNQTTGFGIDIEMGDNEHNVLVIDHLERRVGFATPGREMEKAGTYVSWPFAEYVEVDLGKLERVFQDPEALQEVTVDAQHS